MSLIVIFLFSKKSFIASFLTFHEDIVCFQFSEKYNRYYQMRSRKSRLKRIQFKRIKLILALVARSSISLEEMCLADLKIEPKWIEFESALKFLKCRNFLQVE